MAQSSLVWNLSGIIAYYNGSWEPVEVRVDHTGFFRIGPNVSQYPEIVSFINELGLAPPTIVSNTTVRKFVFRFSATLVAGGRIGVAWDNEKIIAFGDSDTIAALAMDNDFRNYFQIQEDTQNNIQYLVTEDSDFIATADGIRLEI